jgi:hypothetical protein
MHRKFGGLGACECGARTIEIVLMWCDLLSTRTNHVANEDEACSVACEIVLTCIDRYETLDWISQKKLGSILGQLSAENRIKP